MRKVGADGSRAKTGEGADAHGSGAAAGERTVRVATEAEVSWLLGLAAAEGWNPGLDDAAAFRAADPEGFLVAFDGERPVAGVSVVRQDAGHGFLGLYLCVPEARGRGHGWRVWQAGLAHLGARTVGLDGVPAQQANYRASGFAFAWRNTRFAGAMPALAEPDGTLPAPRVATAADLPALCAYDRAIGGVARTTFLEPWFTDTGTRHTLWCERAGEVCALGTVRRCRDGAKIGPLLADTPSLAHHLLLALAGRAEASTVVIDVPDGNAAATAMAVSLGLEPVFETARMYRGDAPRVDLARLHGVSTLELG